MDNNVAAEWAAIEAWAQAHGPQLLEGLRGPVSAEDLDSLRNTGLPIPAALYASLAIHDGEDDCDEGFFPAGGRWLPVAEMLSTRDTFEQALGGLDLDDDITAPLGPMRPVAQSDERLPIIDLNGDVTWFLDFDPAPGGTPGQVIRIDQESSEYVVCAPDFATFLSMYREDLEADRIPLDHDDYDEEDEASLDSGPWPPYGRLPSLQAGAIGDAELKALGAMGRWSVALALVDRLPPTPGLRTRLEARAAQQAGEPKKALRLLDKLASDGHETEDDVLARIDTLETANKPAQALAAAEAALATRPSAALHVRHAELVLDLADEAPVKGRKQQMEWHASPAGQQAAAKARAIAVAGYDAALAIEDRLQWRFDRIEVLLGAERWEEAEADAAALAERIGSDEGFLQRDLDHARELLELARARGEGDGDSDDMLVTMDDLLAGLEAALGGTGTKALGDMREMRDAFAGIVDRESAERAALAAEPGSTQRRAREVADQIVRLYADTAERFAPFDASDLDAKAQRWYDRTREALAGFGFEQCADLEPLRNTELSGNRVLMRLLLDADRRTCAAAYRLVGPFMALEIVELESELEDGRILMTNNSGTSNAFAQPDAVKLLSLPLGTKIPEIVKAHRKRLAGQAVRTVPDLDAVLVLQERQRALKREAARVRGWVGDDELRSLLGASYRELAAAVRAELATRL